MAKNDETNENPIRLISATSAEGTHVPADQVCVTVDSAGTVSIAIPDGDIELHPRAVALVASAMQLEDESTVASLVVSLQT